MEAESEGAGSRRSLECERESRPAEVDEAALRLCDGEFAMLNGEKKEEKGGCQKGSADFTGMVRNRIDAYLEEKGKEVCDNRRSGPAGCEREIQGGWRNGRTGG